MTPSEKFSQIYGEIIASNMLYSSQNLSSSGGLSPTLCQTDYQTVRDGSEREAAGSVCTLDLCNANDHTRSRRQTAAGASGATWRRNLSKELLRHFDERSAVMCLVTLLGATLLKAALEPATSPTRPTLCQLGFNFAAYDHTCFCFTSKTCSLSLL